MFLTKLINAALRVNYKVLKKKKLNTGQGEGRYKKKVLNGSQKHCESLSKGHAQSGSECGLKDIEIETS